MGLHAQRPVVAPSRRARLAGAGQGRRDFPGRPLRGLATRAGRLFGPEKLTGKLAFLTLSRPSGAPGLRGRNDQRRRVPACHQIPRPSGSAAAANAAPCSPHSGRTSQ
jgi:hypothetical protein